MHGGRRESTVRLGETATDGAKRDGSTGGLRGKWGVQSEKRCKKGRSSWRCQPVAFGRTLRAPERTKNGALFAQTRRAEKRGRRARH